MYFIFMHGCILIKIKFFGGGQSTFICFILFIFFHIFIYNIRRVIPHYIDANEEPFPCTVRYSLSPLGGGKPLVCQNYTEEEEEEEVSALTARYHHAFRCDDGGEL